LISGSSDRKIKIWNRDFGGCHRSFFAHDDTITAIQFENAMENDQYLLPGETKKEVALAALKAIESFQGVTNIVLVIQSRERNLVMRGGWNCRSLGHLSTRKSEE
jgi:WD40 repeat protein